MPLRYSRQSIAILDEIRIRHTRSGDRYALTFIQGMIYGLRKFGILSQAEVNRLTISNWLAFLGGTQTKERVL